MDDGLMFNGHMGFQGRGELGSRCKQLGGLLQKQKWNDLRSAAVTASDRTVECEIPHGGRVAENGLDGSGEVVPREARPGIELPPSDEEPMVGQELAKTLKR